MLLLEYKDAVRMGWGGLGKELGKEVI